MENPELYIPKSKLENPEEKGEMIMNKNDEMILVFDAKAFDKLYKEIPSDGVFNLNNDPYVDVELADYLNYKWERFGDVKRRGDMETDPSFKQPIPATIIKQGEKIFVYERLSGGGEERLHGKMSFTVGGHMNEIDNPFNFEHILLTNNSREIFEEVDIINEKNHSLSYDEIFKMMKNSKVLGLIYSEETPVDTVHIGILNYIEIPQDYKVEVKETDSLDGRFMTIEELDESRLENWSRIALSVLK